jgi:hypothetical protein
MTKLLIRLLVLSVLSTYTVFPNNIVYADEFSLGIIIDPYYSNQSRLEFINGFQLAVDQSPDISHPEGQEGGDHLGAMDVNIIIPIIDNSNTDLIVNTRETANTADIIVADLRSTSLELIYETVIDSNTYLLSTQNNNDVNSNFSEYFYGIAALQDTQILLTNGITLFREEYSKRYGHEPTLYAQRGYIAGRMIDLAVGATKNDPADVDTMNNKLNEVLGKSAEDDKDMEIVDANYVESSQVTNQTKGSTDSYWYIATAVASSLLIYLLVLVSQRLSKRHKL